MSHRWIVLAALAVSLVAPVAARADAVPDELAAALRTIATVTSFRTVSTKGKGKSVIEVQRPDRAHLLLDGWDIIRIGNNVWGKFAGGEWRVMSTLGPGKIVQLTSVSLPPNAVVRRVADESDGVSAAHVYAVDGDPSGTQRWYVRISDGHLHKIVGPTPSGVTMTVVIDDYDVPFTIEPPM